jgi:hypothetical protein
VQEVFIVFIFSRSSSFALISLLIVVICSGCSSKKKDTEAPQGEEMDLLSLVSVQVPGWQEEETVLLSETKDMAKYMDSEAEIYLAYGFRRLAVKKYKNERSLPMVLEVYEFDSSEKAYGAYSFDTVGEKPDIGQAAVYGHGLLRFWKGKMLVRVVAEEDYSELEEDILTFGREVDSRILTIGSRPELLSLIPTEKLVPDSLHFFYKDVCLNNIYYIPEFSALCLSDQTKAVTARYALGGVQPALLLLIEYPGEPEAAIAFEGFNTSYLQGVDAAPADQNTKIAQFGEEDYNSMTLRGKFMILVFEARSPGVCVELIASTLAKIEML